VNLALTPAQVAQCIDQIGVGFMFAPNHHSAMKHAAPVRRELGVRTLFNILGPLTNPAGAGNQLMGVFHPDLVGIQARVLQRLGSRHVLVVYGMEGLDEISVAGETLVGELKNDEVREYTIHPRQFGMQTSELSAIQVKDGGESRDMLVAALSSKAGPARDIVALNAGAAIYAAGIAESHEAGVKQALAVISSGAAKAKLDQFVAFTQKLKNA
jgi:anthranilate phosphoribosyltransferase